MLATTLELSPLFCIATRPPVVQTGFALEPLWAQTGWTPETFLGQHPCKFLPLQRFTFMGDGCYGSRVLVFKPSKIFRLLEALLYIGSSFKYIPFCLKGHYSVQSVALCFISPVPFTGCLRAYRFHFTSLHFISPVPETCCPIGHTGLTIDH